MAGSDTSQWLYRGDRSTDRPADLGYYVGYKICEAYYRLAQDKSKAVHELVHGTDAADILRRRGYAGATHKRLHGFALSFAPVISASFQMAAGRMPHGPEVPAPRTILRLH